MNKVLAILLLLCPTLLVAQDNFNKQAHRGGRGLMPENTIAAMLHALDLGANTLEMDVVISKDKKVVVSHDTYMSADFMRKPDETDIIPADAQKLILYKMDYEEIKQFDAGSKPYPQFPRQEKFKTYRPLLADLIDSVDAYVAQKGLNAPLYNIEIKSSVAGDRGLHPDPQEFADLVMAVCESKNLGSRLTIQSFDIRALKLLHEQHPDVKLSYLTASPKSLDENLAILGFKPQIYSPDYKTVTEQIVDNCHSQGIEIIPWTVNSKADIDKLKDMKVDGVISDYPDLFEK